MTKTARRLHVSQPTLSRQLKSLEEELGKKLFVRSNYSIKLTEEGNLLKKRTEKILEMVNKTTEEIQTLDEVRGGDIHIGCAESNGIKYVIDVIKKLQKKYPLIRYHFYSSGTDEVNERMDSGLLDFAIIVQEADVSKYNCLKIPSMDRWGLIMRKDSPLAQKSSIRLEDLCHLPLILSRQAMRQEMPKWFGEVQDQLHIIATYDLLFNASVMVRENFGYALVFEGLIHTGEDGDLCFRPLEPALESPMYVVWKKYQTFTPAAELIMKELKKKFLE